MSLIGDYLDRETICGVMWTGWVRLDTHQPHFLGRDNQRMVVRWSAQCPGSGLATRPGHVFCTAPLHPSLCAATAPSPQQWKAPPGLGQPFPSAAEGPVHTPTHTHPHTHTHTHTFSEGHQNHRTPHVDNKGSGLCRWAPWALDSKLPPQRSMRVHAPKMEAQLASVQARC